MVDQPQAGAEMARTIAWLMRIQALLSAGVGVVFAVIGGLPMALAALAGGGVGLFLTALTGLRVALAQGAEAKQMVRTFYRAMALKFVLAVILFVIVAKWFAGYFVPVVTGYAVTLVAYWLAMQKIGASARLDNGN
ncbi:MAG: ATP synthase subunit I [Wenzhouxiangella sp.]|nr:MAG: ATP synthase subunit I [Wenzhouxiangella sp.]